MANDDAIAPGSDEVVHAYRGTLASPAGFQAVYAGGSYACSGTVVRVERVLSMDRVEAVNLATGAMLEVPLGDLRPIVPSTPKGRGVEQVSDNVRIDPSGKVRTRVGRFVRHLTRRNRPIPNSQVREVAKRLGMSSTTLRKILRRFKETGQIILQLKRGRIKGNKYLPSVVEGFVDQAVAEVYETHRQCPVSQVQKAVVALCTKAGIVKVPARNTLVERIARLKRTDVAQAVGHDDGVRATRLIKGRRIEEEALGTVQVDFTIADLFIVDDETREPLCRPLLGMAIDMATRVIVGAWFFLEAPSHITSGYMTAFSIMPKAGVLIELGLAERFPWPCHGRMHRIFVDNGFRIKSFVDACERRGIDVMFRGRGECQQGGMIERAIGTFLGELHMLHGTTFADPLTRKRARIDPSATACYTMREALQYLVSQIYTYHHNPHGGIQKRHPIDLWKAAFEVNGVIRPPPLPVDLRTFSIPFLWKQLCVVHRQGIKLGTRWYHSEALRPHVGMRYGVYFNKHAPTRVYPEIGRDEFLNVPLADGEVVGSSWWTEAWRRRYRTPRTDDMAHRIARADAWGFQRELEAKALATTRAAKQRDGALPEQPSAAQIDLDATPVPAFRIERGEE